MKAYVMKDDNEQSYLWHNKNGAHKEPRLSTKSNENVHDTSSLVTFKELLVDQDNYSTFLISSIHDVSGFCNRLANVPKFVLPLQVSSCGRFWMFNSMV